MIYRLYEHLLEWEISKNKLPCCVAVVLSSSDLDDLGLARFIDLLSWSQSLGLESLMFYVNGEASNLCPRFHSILAKVPAQVSLHTEKGVKYTGKGGKSNIVISLGYGGKREVTEAFKDILLEVEKNRINPEQIDEITMESHLRFSQKPDLVIRAGGKQLSDFLIWQAAYSELYFTDLDWQFIRKIDFLRAIRDCQKRERRFGR